jgi:hypothetical protein
MDTPLRGHRAGRGWTVEQMETALERLRSRGLVKDDQLAPHGRQLRDTIERRTDGHLAPAVAVLGDHLDELIAVLTPWGDAICAAGGYLSPAVRFTWLPDSVAPSDDGDARQEGEGDVTA